MQYVEIDGKRYDWKAICTLRRQQLSAAPRNVQLSLFDLKEDRRPITHRSADGRYAEPTLFEM